MNMIASVSVQALLQDNTPAAINSASCESESCGSLSATLPMQGDTRQLL